MPPRSELHESQPDAFLPSSSSPTITTPSSPSFTSFLPTTPHRSSPAPASSSSSVGLLTPSSSKASLSPALSRYKGNQQPPSPIPSQHWKPKGPPPSRRLFFPVRASLELHTQPARYMPDETSRPGSPVRRSRAMSPRRPELGTRAPSRCESLLRDTLRRADQQERTLVHRTMSRSPNRWSRGRSRQRGNSLFEALRRDDSTDSDCECEDNVQRRKESDIFAIRSPAQAMAVRSRGAMSGCSTEAGSMPYGSPSSPSPMPSMVRTRTAPAVPRVKSRTNVDEYRVARPPMSPPSGRRSLPNTVSQSHASISPSNNASPKQRANTLSPHESVLRAKLEIVLQKAGPSSVEESGVPSQVVGRVRRNHHRAFSHGVTVVTSPKVRDERSSNSSSPQSLAPSSLSNSAIDLARANSTTSQRRESIPYRTSPSSPPELLTPPPTPPFNARTASEVCKRIDGYVSFASVEGLGEPSGLDIDGEESDDGLRKLGKWFRMLPMPFLNGTHLSSGHEAGQTVVGRQRSGSSVSR